MIQFLFSVTQKDIKTNIQLTLSASSSNLFKTQVRILVEVINGIDSFPNVKSLLRYYWAIKISCNVPSPIVGGRVY